MLGYVVMPEHFHLLMDRTSARRSLHCHAMRETDLRAESGSKAQVARSHEAREAHADWQPRFYDFNVYTEHKRIEKLRYMHNNPVKRGLVEEPEQWSWSSSRYYLYREAGPVAVNDTDILLMSMRPPA